jgi:hypothetical protein
MEDMKPTRSEGHGMTRTIEARAAVEPHIRPMSGEASRLMIPSQSQRCSHIALSDTMKRLDLLLNCGF